MADIFRWASFAICGVMVVSQLAYVAVWKPWQNDDTFPQLSVYTAIIVSIAITLLELNLVIISSDAMCNILLVGLRYVAVPRMFLLSLLHALYLRRKAREGPTQGLERLYMAVSLSAAILGLVIGIVLRITRVSHTGNCVIVDLEEYFYVGIVAVLLLATLLWKMVGKHVSYEEKVMLRLVAATWLCFGCMYFVLSGVLRSSGESAEANSGGLHLLWTLMMTFTVFILSPPRMRYTKLLVTWRMRKVAATAVSASDLEVGETQSSGASSEWTQALTSSVLGFRRGSTSTVGSEETVDYRFSPRSESFDIPNPGYGKSLESISPGEHPLECTEEVKGRDSPRKDKERKMKKRCSLSQASQGSPPLIKLQRRPRSVPGSPAGTDIDDDGKSSQKSYSNASTESPKKSHPLRKLSSHLSKLFHPVPQETESRSRRNELLEPNLLSPTMAHDGARNLQATHENIEALHERDWVLESPSRQSMSTLNVSASTLGMGLDEASMEDSIVMRTSDISPKFPRMSPQTSVGMELERGSCIRVAFDDGRRASSGSFLAKKTLQRHITVCMEDIFDSMPLLSVLLDLAERRRCTELVRFCQAARLYKTSTYIDTTSQYESCKAIVRTFLDEGTDDEINLSNRTKVQILENVRSLESFTALGTSGKTNIFDSAFNEMKDLLFHNLADELRNSPQFLAVVSGMVQRQRASSDPGREKSFRGQESPPNKAKQRAKRASYFWMPSISLSSDTETSMNYSSETLGATSSSAADDSIIDEGERHRVVLERIEESFRNSQDSPCDDSVSRQGN